MTNLIPQTTWFRPLSRFDADGGLYSVLSGEMDRFYEELSGRSSAKANRAPQARINVSETESSIEIDADLPGVDEKDFDVVLTGDVLTIKGEKRDERDESHRDWNHQERTFGKFSRSITLPFEPDAKTVKTLYSKGVLKITLPKSAAVKEHTVKIPVRVAA